MVVPTAPRDPSWAVCAPNDVEEAGVAFGHHDPVFMTVEMLAQLPAERGTPGHPHGGRGADLTSLSFVSGGGGEGGWGGGEGAETEGEEEGACLASGTQQSLAASMHCSWKTWRELLQSTLRKS